MRGNVPTKRGDGLVEQMNRSLPTLLCSNADSESDWEERLQLFLFLYRTTKHAATGLSPYEILFVSKPPSLHFFNLPSTLVLEPAEYIQRQCYKQTSRVRELVDANLVLISAYLISAHMLLYALLPLCFWHGAVHAL